MDEIKEYILNNPRHVLIIIYGNIQFLKLKNHDADETVNLAIELNHIKRKVNPYVYDKKQITPLLVKELYDLYAVVRGLCNRYDTKGDEGYKVIADFIIKDKPSTYTIDNLSDSNPCNWKILALTNKDNKKQPAMKTKEYYYHASIEPVVVLNETRSVPGDPVLNAEALNSDERLITVEQEHTVKTRLVKKIKRDITLCMLVTEKDKNFPYEDEYHCSLQIMIGLAVRNPHYDEFNLERAKEVSKGKADNEPIFVEQRDSIITDPYEIKSLPGHFINGQIANKLLSRVAKDVELNFGNYVAAFNNEWC